MPGPAWFTTKYDGTESGIESYVITFDRLGVVVGMCSDADILVHTVVRRDLIEQIGLSRLTDVLDHHSSVPDAAPYRGPKWRQNSRSHPLGAHTRTGNRKEWLDQATAHFNGEVVLASDLLTFAVTR